MTLKERNPFSYSRISFLIVNSSIDIFSERKFEGTRFR